MSRGEGNPYIAESKCPTGKLPYLTYRSALRAIKAFKRPRRHGFQLKDYHLSIYKCSECPYNHVGNAEIMKEVEINTRHKKQYKSNKPISIEEFIKLKTRGTAIKLS
jgi:hypothetical protein